MSEELQEALEEISMLIIANSGAARSAALDRKSTRLNPVTL